MRRAIGLVTILGVAAVCAAPRPPEPPPARAALPPVAAVRYRRLAWSPEYRDRNWLDEVYIPSLHVAFNLETEIDSSTGSIDFFPKLNAFLADGPVGYSDDLYGLQPHPPEVTPIEVPGDVAEAVAEHARIVKALEVSARVLGKKVDETHVLPPVVGSPDWKPSKDE